MSKNKRTTAKKDQKKSNHIRLAEYKDAFEIFDKDKSGDISVHEISKLFKALGHSMTDKEIQKLVDEVNISGEESIGFDEFVQLMEKLDSQVESEEEAVIRAFKVFDRDQNGFLSVAEFKHILVNLGDKFTEAEVDEIFREADLDGDGQIDYHEFVDFWKNK
jgi:calmodulin